MRRVRTNLFLPNAVLILLCPRFRAALPGRRRATKRQTLRGGVVHPIDVHKRSLRIDRDRRLPSSSSSPRPASHSLRPLKVYSNITITISFLLRFLISRKEGHEQFWRRCRPLLASTQTERTTAVFPGVDFTHYGVPDDGLGELENLVWFGSW